MTICIDAEVKGLCGTYQRIIMIPRPDYASRYGKILPTKHKFMQKTLYIVIWRNLVLRNGGRISDMLDLSCLAKVTDGYTPGHVNTAVQQVLTERRIAQVKPQMITSIYQIISPATQKTSDCFRTNSTFIEN